MSTPKRCEFCGRELEPIELPSIGKLRAPELYRACTCPDAQARDAAIEAERRAEEERRETERIEMRYKLAQIPRRYWHAECDDERFDGWLAHVRSGGGLFFTGLQGRGKTHAACAILCRLLEEDGKRVRFADIEGIEREVTSAWRSRDTSESAVIDKYTNADVVVIDDLGAEELTTVTMKVLRAVISGREANMLPTIFTSNYTRLDFANHLAQEASGIMAKRIASRISSMTEVAEFNGNDRRLARG